MSFQRVVNVEPKTHNNAFTRCCICKETNNINYVYNLENKEIEVLCSKHLQEHKTDVAYPYRLHTKKNLKNSCPFSMTFSRYLRNLSASPSHKEYVDLKKHECFVSSKFRKEINNET